MQDIIKLNGMVVLHISCMCVFLCSHGGHLHMYFSGTSIQMHLKMSASNPQYILTVGFVII